MAWGLPGSRVGHLRSGDASQQSTEHARHDVRLGMGEHALGLARVEPHPVAVRTLIDLDAVPFPGDQIVAAFGALHVVRAPQMRLRSDRSEEHTSELQSLAYLVCRLLLEKKKASGTAARNDNR